MSKTILATIAAMLSLGGIAACAQPPSSHAQSEASASVMEEGARAAAAADAAAMGSESKDGNKEKVPVTTETMPEKAVGPPIASTMLQDRILRLVESLRSPSNVTRHHLEEVMQFKLSQDAAMQEWWTYEGATDAGWAYTVFVDDGKRREFPGVDISFSAGDVEGGGRATTCTYELEAFAHSLTILGYTRHPGWKQPGGHLVFSRNATCTRFGTTVKVRKYVQQLGVEAADFQYCVYVISISAGESPDGE